MASSNKSMSILPSVKEKLLHPAYWTFSCKHSFQCIPTNARYIENQNNICFLWAGGWLGFRQTFSGKFMTAANILGTHGDIELVHSSKVDNTLKSVQGTDWLYNKEVSLFLVFTSPRLSRVSLQIDGERFLVFILFQSFLPWLKLILNYGKIFDTHNENLSLKSKGEQFDYKR